MDDERFDALTRTLAGVGTRRGAVRLIGAAAVAALAPALAAGKAGRKGNGKGKGNKRDCPRGQKKCNGSCVDLTSDFFNCGSCGNVCSSAAGTLCCGSACVDTTSNKAHCGGCFVACEGADAGCFTGICTRCPVGQVRCEGTGTCADVQTDPKNCGTCGRECATNETCESGRCACAGPHCVVSPGTTRCCPATAGVCCDGGGCCPNGQVCCPGGRCCPGGTACVADNKCCPEGAVLCADGVCCSPPTVCSGNGTCAVIPFSREGGERRVTPGVRATRAKRAG